MASIAELRVELEDISGHLGDSVDMLKTFAHRLEMLAARTSSAIEGTLRPDIQQPAVQGIQGAKQQAEETAVLLDRVKLLLETYVSGL